MKMILPLTRDRFKLLQDWPEPFLVDINGYMRPVTLPAGSIISFERVDITKVSKMEQQIRVSIRVVPDHPEWTMKKYGGKAPYGYHAGTTIANLRNIELEHIEGMP